MPRRSPDRSRAARRRRVSARRPGGVKNRSRSRKRRGRRVGRGGSPADSPMSSSHAATRSRVGGDPVEQDARRWRLGELAFEREGVFQPPSRQSRRPARPLRYGLQRSVAGRRKAPGPPAESGVRIGARTYVFRVSWFRVRPIARLRHVAL